MTLGNTILLYLIAPLAIGLVTGFFGKPDKWKREVMIGFGLVMVGQSALVSQMKANPSLSLDNAMSSSGLIMSLGALLLGRGVVLVFRFTRQVKNQAKNGNPNPSFKRDA
jgi:hypothetical protein